MEENLSRNQLQLPVVTLRAMEPEDLDVLYTIENDEERQAMIAANIGLFKN